MLLTAPLFVFLAACQPDAETAPPQVRPVRTVTVVKRDVGETVSYTGRIEAEDEARLAFRISGRMVERSVNVGDQVGPGQIVAKLEPHNQLNALRTGSSGH
jgi:multidrug efflux pump subunit AcrA (membrane-fusion protein)